MPAELAFAWAAPPVEVCATIFEVAAAEVTAAVAAGRLTSDKRSSRTGDKADRSIRTAGLIMGLVPCCGSFCTCACLVYPDRFFESAAGSDTGVVLGIAKHRHGRPKKY